MYTQGIHQLADDLVASTATFRYNQDTWGAPAGRMDEATACGTAACLAGFCMARKIGVDVFNRMVEDKWDKNGDGIDGYDARHHGATQLGIPVHSTIFNPIVDWPLDLASEYMRCRPGGKGRVVVALMALQRLQPDGTIDPDPRAVHTKLPQLKALLEEKALCERMQKEEDEEHDRA